MRRMNGGQKDDEEDEGRQRWAGSVEIVDTDKKNEK